MNSPCFLTIHVPKGVLNGADCCPVIRSSRVGQMRASNLFQMQAMQSLNSSLIAVSWTAVADTILNLILNQKKEERENANDSNTALEWQMH